MESKVRAAAGQRRRRRRKTFLITAVVCAAIIGLIYYEQIAVLYVLSTFSVAALLFIVAWSDMGPARRPATEPPPLDDSASIGSGITAAAASEAGCARAPRPARPRR